jgi:hypothetical protein
MNFNQIGFHLDYLIDKIKLNQQEDKCMEIIHQFSPYFIGNKNYLEELNQKRITKLGILHQLKNDILELSKPPAPMPAPVPHVQGIAGQLDFQVIKDFTKHLCTIVYSADSK